MLEPGSDGAVDGESAHCPASSKGAVPRQSGGVAIRGASPDRRADQRERSFAVLDGIERGLDDDGVAALVERARGGDDLAFAEIYVRFFDRVNRYLLIALKNPEDALDAAQQVFLKLLEALPGHEPLREPFPAWLFSVVRNHAIDQQRRSHRADALHDTLVERSTLILGEEDAGDIRALIATLPQTQQRVLVLRFVCEMTPGEAAEALGTSPDAVRHTQMRALRALARSDSVLASA
jgi:RNA polymerase sigma-70 factor (ECF subfamily)